MERLSPQKDYILSFLRKGDWVCGRAWLSRVKDDRRRIFELKDYMASKGYEIVGEACKGRFCGVKDCPLYARRAQKIVKVAAPTLNKENLILTSDHSHNLWHSFVGKGEMVGSGVKNAW